MCNFALERWGFELVVLGLKTKVPVSSEPTQTPSFCIISVPFGIKRGFHTSKPAFHVFLTLSDFQGAERERESKLIKSRQTRTHLNRYFSTFNRRFKHIFASQMLNNQHNAIVTIEIEIS